MTRWSSVFLGLLLVWAAPAAAQTCLGSPSFRDNPYQVALEASFTDNARSIGGLFAGGGETLFGGAGVSVARFDVPGDDELRSTGVTLFAGAELAADQRATILLCPVAQLDFGTGPDVGAIDVSTLTLRAGGNLGVIVSDRDGLTIVPTFGLAAVFQRSTVEIGDIDESESDAGGLAMAGVGFIFNRNVGITPQLLIPFAVGGSDAVFVIKLSLNFGR